MGYTWINISEFEYSPKEMFLRDCCRKMAQGSLPNMCHIYLITEKEDYAKSSLAEAQGNCTEPQECS